MCNHFNTTSQPIRKFWSGTKFKLENINEFTHEVYEDCYTDFTFISFN